MKHFIFLILSLGLWSCKVYQETAPPVHYRNYAQFESTLFQNLESCQGFADSVITIRNHIHTFYRLGREKTDLEKKEKVKFWKWAPQEFFEHFNQDQISGKCGVASEFLKCMYTHLGFQAFTFSIGFPDESDTRGHIQCLVLDHNSQENPINQVIVMDPMFNFHYEVGGNPIGLGEMISMLTQGKGESITLNTTPGNGLHLQRFRMINPFFPEIDWDQQSKVFKSRNPKAKYIVSAPRTIDRYLKGGFKKLYRKILQSRGIKVDFSQPSAFKNTVLAIRGIYGGGEESAKLYKAYQALLAAQGL